MSLYDAIKDAAKIAQKADNIELYRKLIDLGKQACELQEEVLRLREENSQLKNRHITEKMIIRHQEPVVTKTDDSVPMYYCAHCWDNEGKLFQICCSEDGTFSCPHCNTTGIYDFKKRKAYEAEEFDLPIIF